jgi:competence protein ComEC
MNRFRQIPFLRIFLPFLAGILLALCLEQQILFLIPLFFLLFVLLLTYFIFLKTHFNKTVFLFVCDACIFVFGMLNTQQQTLLWKPNYYGQTVDVSKELQILAVVSDVPSQKPKTLKVHLEVQELSLNGKTGVAQGKIIAYFKKHNSAGKIKAGQTLSLQTQLVEIEPPRNPGEFDYKRYLYNRQIYHVAFVDSQKYEILPSAASPLNLTLYALKCKQWIVDRLRTASLSNEAFSICSALLTGFDEEIPQDIMRAFSHSGTLHVLSVSGLHTGLIFAFLSVIFDFFDRRKKYGVFKFTLLVFVLWAFAFVTGLAAPVLRSVVMLSLFAIGSIFFHNEPKNQLNLLFVSAFTLLCLNPYFITEVGFQLSFSAIFGLIVFEPYFSQFWEPQNTAVKWIWKSTTTSFAATLSTLPFTLFYFKQFPLWFFIANPIVVPASFLLLLLAIPAMFHWSWVSICINFVSEKLIQFITLFDSGALTHLDGINFSLSDSFWICALIVILSLAFYKRSFRQLQYSLALFFCWQLTATLQDYFLFKKQVVAVYSVRNTFACAAKEGRRFYFSVSDSGAFERYIKPHAISLGNPYPQSLSFNAIETGASQIIFLGHKNAFPNANTKMPTYLVLSKDFVLNVGYLSRFGRIEAIIADQSLHRKSLGQVEELCRKFGIKCYSTRKQGAFVLSNNEIENWR